MTDGRRRRWIKWDVYFLDGPLGLAIRRRFGPTGISLFLGFIAGCKRNHHPGRITFSSPEEALVVMGLPGLRLVDEDGKPFELDAFWTVLAHHKQITRRRSGRLTHVISSRWTDWQEDADKPKTGTQKPRSAPQNTGAIPGDCEGDTGLEKETERETEILLLPPPPLTVVPANSEEEEALLHVEKRWTWRNEPAQLARFGPVDTEIGWKAECLRRRLANPPTNVTTVRESCPNCRSGWKLDADGQQTTDRCECVTKGATA